MPNFSAGDVVICIDDEPTPDRIIWPIDPWVRQGRIYRIKSISTNSLGERGVILCELENRHGSSGWYAWRFRRLEAADDQFMQMLTASKRELVDA